MDGVYDESNTVGNPNIAVNRDGIQQEIPNSDRNYQQQYSQNQTQNQPTNDRPMEIPAAKVCNFISISVFFTHTHNSSLC